MNRFYPKAREAFAKKQINWEADAFTVYAVDLADYTYSDAHSALADIPVAARVDSAALPAGAGRTATNGILDADNVILGAVVGDPFEAVIIVHDSTGTPVVFFDTAAAGGGFSIVPDGRDVLVTWPDDANKIGRL